MLRRRAEEPRRGVSSSAEEFEWNIQLPSDRDMMVQNKQVFFRLERVHSSDFAEICSKARTLDSSWKQRCDCPGKHAPCQVTSAINIIVVRTSGARARVCGPAEERPRET